MIWDGLVQPIGKYCSIRRMEYPDSQMFGRIESAPDLCTILSVPLKIEEDSF